MSHSLEIMAMARRWTWSYPYSSVVELRAPPHYDDTVPARHANETAFREILILDCPPMKILSWDSRICCARRGDGRPMSRCIVCRGGPEVQ